jgi:uncharacterized protein (UPF0147 family)
MLEDLSLTPTPVRRAATPIISTLQELNIEDALLTQYNNASELLAQVLHDEGTPANQRAQCINAVSTILVQITKSQSDLYNAERVKKLELAMIEAIKTLSKETQEVFFTSYALILGS